jgi:hypothetical protein
MQTETVTVKNPAVTAAIREAKAELKKMSAEQKAAKQAFRKATSEWAKKPHPKGYPPTSEEYAGDYLTVRFILYERLRQSKHHHLQHEFKWFNVEGYTGINRKHAFKQAYKELVEKHPEAAKTISDKPREEDKP